MRRRLLVQAFLLALLRASAAVAAPSTVSLGTAPNIVLSPPRADASHVYVPLGGGYVPLLNGAGDTAFGQIGAAPGGACQTGAWTGAVSGSNPPSATPTPLCTGAFMAPTMSIPAAAVVGIGTAASAHSGDQTHVQYDQALIQAITQQDGSRQENGLHINFIDQTGLLNQTSPNGGNYSEKVALYVTARAVAGGGPAWAFNPDLVCANGFTQGCITEEIDSTVFDMAHGIGSNSFGTQTYRTFTGFPLTSGEFWSSAGSGAGTIVMNLTAGSVNGTITSGLASVGDIVQNKTGGSSLAPYTTIQSINGSTTALNASGSVVLNQPALATVASESETNLTFNMLTGITFAPGSGPNANLIRDVTIADGTTSQTFAKLTGAHYVGLDTQNDTLSYLFVTKAGQKGCFYGTTFCLYYDSGNATLDSSNNFKAPLVVSDTLYSSGTDTLNLGSAVHGAGVEITDPGSTVVNALLLNGGPSGFGPTVASASGPLNLTAGGANNVQVLKGLTLSAGILASALPTSGGTVKGSMCVDTTGVVYVKTTTGACL